MVVSVKGEGDSTELDIAFPQPIGIKRLLAQFAPIEKRKRRNINERNRTAYNGVK